MKKTRNGKKCQGKFEGYIQRQRHQTNDQNNDSSNNGISNYPEWSRKIEYQKGRERQN